MLMGNRTLEPFWKKQTYITEVRKVQQKVEDKKLMRVHILPTTTTSKDIGPPSHALLINAHVDGPFSSLRIFFLFPCVCEWIYFLSFACPQLRPTLRAFKASFYYHPKSPYLLSLSQRSDNLAKYFLDFLVFSWNLDSGYDFFFH